MQTHHYFSPLSAALGLGIGLAFSLVVPAVAQGQRMHQAWAQEDLLAILAEAPDSLIQTASTWQSEPIATIALNAKQMGFSGSGQQLVTLTSEGDRFQIWDTQTSESLAELAADAERRFEAVAINEAGNQVAVIVQTLPTNTLELWLWHLEAEAPLWRQPLGVVQSQFRDGDGFFIDSPTTVAFRPGDEAILTQVSLGFGPADGPADTQLRLHDVATGEVVHVLETTPGASPGQFEFSPDGAFLASVSYVLTGLEMGGLSDEVIDVWQLNDGTHHLTLRPDEDDFSFMDMVFTPDGSLNVLTQNFYDIRLDTWNLDSEERIARITELPDIDRTDGLGRLSPDGEYYFVRSDVAGTRLINTQTLSVTHLETYVDRLAVFNGTGDYLAVKSFDGIQIFSQLEP